jgi:hypothetical protein
MLLSELFCLATQKMGFDSRYQALNWLPAFTAAAFHVHF